jgi:GTPase SAR1 family protein
MHSNYSWNNKKMRNNSPLFPEIFRCLIIGESASGKTCFLFRLFLENLIDYDHLIIVGDSLYQTNYKILKQLFDKGFNQEYVRNVFNKQNIIEDCSMNIDLVIEHLNGKKSEPITVQYFDSSDLIPDPSSLKDNTKYLVVFDDVVTRKNQEVMKSYFTRGRHKNAIVLYLSQSYFALDRKAIRMNSNILILFR